MRESEQRARRWVLRELTRLCERDQQAKASAETPRVTRTCIARSIINSHGIGPNPQRLSV
jgi:hypothetical protein